MRLAVWTNLTNAIQTVRWSKRSCGKVYENRVSNPIEERWMVFLVRDEQRILARAPTPGQSWALAAGMAEIWIVKLKQGGKMKMLLILFLFLAGCNEPKQSTPVPTSKPISWEYSVNYNESGEHFPPHLVNLVKEGWEVYLVTGGYPYVTSSRTVDGVTTNTTSFSPRVYFLKRQKAN